MCLTLELLLIHRMFLMRNAECKKYLLVNKSPLLQPSYSPFNLLNRKELLSGTRA